MVENVNKAKMKILSERNFLLTIILRVRRIEERKPIVWARPIVY